jgi:pre-mRNA-splicing factor CDC5/CEF1
MRIMVKGGVWKNTEDEILKAAVMKYGKNQWARISSLLVRKSAKQCKARWYEWIDPSIKKTEWSREEEEKLLHLAKIMPNQWKTIAPIVGRTASQCLEHYDKLLDAAQNREEGYDPAEDPRRLRAGEIDPFPESKPARPDPVDMDEDEKEMLSEARARLANTKGKKAKRKAREKQLEEARRLASLQKRRELKAAGIEMPRAKKKIKGIDYNKEIPFQRKPAPGFYEVDWEKETPKPGFQRVLLSELDGKRRRDEEEEARKEDAKKQRKKKEKDLPQHILQINKLNDPETIIQRTRLALPDPTLNDQDLENLAKMTDEEKYALSLVEEGSDATKSLLPSYGATPMRPPRAQTARTPARQDNLKREAQNLIAMTAAATPLLGGENPELGESDFSSILPKPQVIQTPNVLATPVRGVGATPKGGMTPARDAMGINRQEMEADDKYTRSTKIGGIRAALANLPKPQNDYEIQLPELPSEEQEEREEELTEQDASDLLLKQQRLEEERESVRLKLRSQVLQRGLPRPVNISSSFKEFESKNEDPYLKQAEELLRKEIISFITYEAAAYPLKGVKPPSSASYNNSFALSDMEEAKRLIAQEVGEVKSTVYKGGFSEEEFDKAWNETREEFIYVPTQRKYVRTTQASKKDKIESLSQSLDNVRKLMGKEAARAQKLEQKLNIYNGGYQNRAGTLFKQIYEAWNQYDQGYTELQCFTALKHLENEAIPNRIEQLKTMVKEQEEREGDLQKKYQNLITERDNLLAAKA